MKDSNILHNFNDVISNSNILTAYEKLETQSKHINWKDSNFDFHELAKLRKGHESNPIIDYLNINHLSSKTDYLREICSKTSTDILCIDETKLDSSYPDAQFEISSYQYKRCRKERKKKRGCKIYELIRTGVITKRLKAFEGHISETICLEFTIPKYVWFITYVF